MFNSTSVFHAAVACIAMAFPAFAEEVSADTVIATVNGKSITLGHMIVVREGLPDQYRELPNDVLFNGILDQLVQQTVLADTVTSETLTVKLRKENEIRAILAGAAIDGIVDAAVTDEALQEAYDQRFEGVEQGQEYNASHILVATKEEAEEISKQLEAGVDFAELAKEKSTGPSGPNGGELGWFGPGMMVKPFEDAVVALEPGKISGPLETQFGWHVIKLNESRLQPAPTLDDVRDELVAELQNQTIEDQIKTLTDSAEIVRAEIEDLDPNILSNTSLIEE